MNTAATLNNMSSVNWIATIPGLEELVLKLTKFQLPEVNAGATALGNRTDLILQAGGDHIQFDNLSVEFLVDENLRNYIRLYKWMRSNTQRAIDVNTSIFVHFTGNDKRFQGVEVEFYEAFPITLSALDLDTDGNETDMHCNATFAYTAFDFVGQTDRDKPWSTETIK